MRLSTCWMPRCRARVDSWGQALQGVLVDSRPQKDTMIHRGHFLPFGRHCIKENVMKSSVSWGSPVELSTSQDGVLGPQMTSKEKDFTERASQAVRYWSWLGFTRSLSISARPVREVDEGHWKYSPEWWGTQDGGWGRNEGETVFEMPSLMGNGVVSVTSHPASMPITQSAKEQAKHESGLGGKGAHRGALYQLLGYEWRVLRFNTVTRQSVAKVKVLATSSGDVILLQQPNCIAFEYVKSMISSGLAAVSLSGLDLQCVRNGEQKMRILCIGLGGGSLALFLAQNLPGATVDVVEIDATVIRAAIEAIGFPPSTAASFNRSSAGSFSEEQRAESTSKQIAEMDQAILWGDLLQRIHLHENDGEVFVCEQARKVINNEVSLQYDLVFVDAYDGEDVMPPKLWDRNGPFLGHLGSLLSADHGTVVVNLHTDLAPPTVLERISGRFGPGFDPMLPQGKIIEEAAHAYRNVLLQQSQDSMGSYLRGLAFTVAVSSQGNITLVVSRGDSVKALRFQTTSEKFKKESSFMESLVRLRWSRTTSKYPLICPRESQGAFRLWSQVGLACDHCMVFVDAKAR